MAYTGLMSSSLVMQTPPVGVGAVPAASQERIDRLRREGLELERQLAAVRAGLEREMACLTPETTSV